MAIKYTEEQGLNSLREYIDKIGHIPSSREYAKSKTKPCKNWFSDKFGSWEKALNQIGFTKQKTDEELLNILRDYYNKNGKSPTSKELTNKNGFPSTIVFYARFNTNSWNKILELAGLDLNHFQGYTKEDALNNLVEYYNKFKKIPTREEYRESGYKPCYDFYYDNFTSFEYAFHLAGIIEKPLNDDEKLIKGIEELKQLANKLNRCPTVSEFENIEHKGFVRRDLERKLNMKYNNICRKYIPEYTVNGSKDTTIEEVIEELHKLKDKLGRPPIFKEFNEITKYSYSLFQGKFNMSYNQLIESLGWIPTGSTTFQKDTDVMLDEFYQYFKLLGRIPHVTEMSSYKNISSYETYTNLFGSIKNVCNLLNIDYDTNYLCNTFSGVTCLDNNNHLCKSLAERDISNYLISKNIKFEKETKYSELIEGCKQRFDWKLYINDEIYYVEYFGLYSRKPRGKIMKVYTEKTKRKIKKLYKSGNINNCIFIFNYDYQNKLFDKVFKNIL